MWILDGKFWKKMEQNGCLLEKNGASGMVMGRSHWKK